MAEPSYLGSNINLVKAHNLQALLLSLLHEGDLSRVELAKRTYLSTTTITNLTAELIEAQIISENLKPNYSASQSPARSVGRPRTLLHLVPEARFAIGIHVGIGLFRVALVNLFDEMIASGLEHFNFSDTPEQVLEQMARMVEKTIMDSQVDPQKILGVGVGASGLVDYQAGINVLAVNLGWRKVAIQDILEQRLGFPVVVDNNVRAMALGEALFGCGRQVESLAFVYGRIGVGAGFVFGGQVYRGSSTGAGEIGHVTMITKDGDQCRCGKTGCLETLVSEPVILKYAYRIAQENPQGLLAHVLQTPGEDRPIDKVFNAARQGDLQTIKMIAARARFLGIAMANLVNIFNPELILLGGVFAQGHDLFIPTVSQTMREMAFAGMGEKVRLQPTSFGWRAGVVGAGALALSRFFYHKTTPIQKALPAF
jgi:glucokinase-like ROK family protein